MSDPILTAEAVHALLKRCLHTPEERGKYVDEPMPGETIVEGVTATWGFHPERIKQAAPEIAALLDELPGGFHEGGGWSFLNACMDKHDRQWGEHRDVEGLCCLAIGAGLGSWPFPRDLWGVFPGGMPYFAVGAPKAVAEPAPAATP